MVGVAGGQPIGTRRLRGHRWGLPLLPLPAPRDGGGQACREEGQEEAQKDFLNYILGFIFFQIILFFFLYYTDMRFNFISLFIVSIF